MPSLRVSATAVAGLAILALAACSKGGGGAARPDAAAPAASATALPTGYGAFRRWESWPLLRVGTRTYMRSTYDRAGGNEGADASHFLREEANGTFTTLDVAGAGFLSFVRTNHWHGSPWHYTVDAADNVVSESSTADPNNPVAGSTFVPGSAFPAPLALTWSTTQGADLSWIPIGFQDQLSLGYERTHYGTGYYIYQLVAAGAEVTDAPATWSLGTAPPPDVVDLVGRVADDLVPAGADVTVQAGSADVAAAPGTSTVVALLAGGPAAVRALRFQVPAASALALGRARLRITWDDRALASIDAPVALFFGAGTLYNRTGRELLVGAFPASIRFAGGTVSLTSTFPMPFQRDARIELVSTGEAIAGVSFEVRTASWSLPANQAGYLHATYRDQGTPTPGQDLVLLDTTVDEGGGLWCGSFVGTSFVFSDRADLTTLEGDPRFFFDDSLTPQAQGTGTEEWGGGGDYWGGVTMTLPFAGHPTGAPSAAAMLDAEDGIESAYRFLLADLFPFGRNARIQLEHGGADDSTAHYRTLAFWYGLPGACLVPTDSLHVGDPADEAAHAYTSPDASGVVSVTSRYEWGVDTFNGQEVYPATTDFGRTTTGTSELTLAIDPDNLGVLLRRKLDYAIPDQRAEVWVGDGDTGGELARAGVWFLAGSNRCLYSNPPDELGAPSPVDETSNRRFRDDEMLIPRALTQGRRHIRVRVVSTPVSKPLFPGAPLDPMAGAWSEMRYDAYVWKLPPAPP